MSRRPRSTARQAVRWLVLPALLLISGTVGARPARKPSPPSPERQLAKTLARLDDLLDLGTFPDSSPLWPARLAAALEARAAREPGSALVRGLAVELRRLPLDRPLGPPPESRGGPPTRQVEPARAARIQRLLAAALQLEEKLVAAAAQPAPGSGSAALFAGLAISGNDACGAAASISTGTFTGTSAGASNDGTATCGSSNASPDVWFVFTAPTANTYSFDTFGSSFDTVLSLYDGCDGGNGRSSELACSDDAFAGTTRSALTYTLAAAEAVTVRLSGFSGAAGSYVLNVAPSRGIRGTVRRGDTHAALAGVYVDIYDDTGSFTTSAMTVTDGSYATVQLPAGTYYAEVDASGFLRQDYDGIDCPAYGTCSPLDATPIVVGDSYVEGVDFDLAQAATLSGLLTDAATGDLLSGYVHLNDENGHFLDTDFVSSDGAYAISGLAAGKYYLVAEAYGYRPEIYDDVPCLFPCSVTSGTQIQLAAAEVLDDLDFALDANPRIEGTVVEAGSGDPVLNEQVMVYDDTGTLWDWTFTGTGGAYRFSYLGPGTYYVKTASDHHVDELYDDLPCATTCTVTSGTPVTADYGPPTTGIDFELVPFGKIAGTVTVEGTGVPLPDTRVVAYDSDGYEQEHTTSGADGTYRMPGLPDGSYYVASASLSHDNEVFDDHLCGAGCDPTTGEPVAVSAGSVTGGIDFALRLRGQLTGTVTHRVSGQPLESIVIQLFDATGDFEANTVTGADGSYRFAGVSAGDHFLSTLTRWEDYPYVDEVYDDLPCPGLCNASTGTPVSVVSEMTTSGIDFALDRLGFVEGTVAATDPGVRLYDIELVLYDEAGDPAYYTWASNSGSYRIAGVQPGTYHLRTDSYSHDADLEEELFDDVPCDPSCDFSQGTALPLGLNQGVAGADFLLSACPASSYRSIYGVQILSSSYELQACEAVTAASSTVTAGAAAVFRAGRRVVLGNGFAVAAGASFRAVIEPDWSAD